LFCAAWQIAHLQLWCRLLQLPPSVYQATVLRELRVLSPSHIWLRSACRFWNALAQGSMYVSGGRLRFLIRIMPSI